MNTPYAIYDALTDPDPSLAMLDQVPKMLECIEKLFSSFGLSTEDIGREPYAD